MHTGLASAAAIIAVIGVSVPSFGQAAPSGATVSGARAGIPRGLLSQDQFNKLQDYADDAKRLTKDDKANGKTLEQALAEDKAAAIALVKAAPLACDVTDAIMIAKGPKTVGGKTVDTATYEAACTNGAGYFLIAQTGEKTDGYSCFAADSLAKADLAAKRKPGPVCQLPPNGDLKVSLNKLFSTSGLPCTVRDFAYIGPSKAAHVDFAEAACEDGKGYIVKLALPGAAFPPQFEDCQSSGKHGLGCTLTKSGPVVSPKYFRDQLAEKKLACTATDSTTRIIGEQASAKRYVVEFQCPEQSRGLVAFFPEAGSKSPFEVADCLAAAKKGAICTLPGNPK